MLLAYAKMALYDELLASDLPDDPYLLRRSGQVFPAPAAQALRRARSRSHRLRREIIATLVANSLVNRGLGEFVGELGEQTGRSPAAVARAYIVARDAFAPGAAVRPDRAAGRADRRRPADQPARRGAPGAGARHRVVPAQPAEPDRHARRASTASRPASRACSGSSTWSCPRPSAQRFDAGGRAPSPRSGIEARSRRGGCAGAALPVPGLRGGRGRRPGRHRGGDRGRDLLRARRPASSSGVCATCWSGASPRNHWERLALAGLYEDLVDEHRRLAIQALRAASWRRAPARRTMGPADALRSACAQLAAKRGRRLRALAAPAGRARQPAGRRSRHARGRGARARTASTQPGEAA